MVRRNAHKRGNGGFFCPKQVRISDASRPQCRLVTPRATPSACLIAYWVRRKAWKPSNTVSHASCVLSKATEARSAVVAGQTGGAEEVRQGKGVPFRRALHTFGTPCTLRCTPFSIEVCRRFLLFSLVYEPFPTLSCLPARHAHLFSNDLYTRERDIYFFIYKT